MPSKRSTEYYFMDTETNPIEPNTYLNHISSAVVDEKGNKRFFVSMEEMEEFIISKLSQYRTPVFYFHNLEFDLSVFMASMLEKLPKEIDLDIIVRNSNVLCIRFYKLEGSRKRKMGEIRDFFALLPSSIERMGKDLNFKKLDFDYNILKKPYEQLSEEQKKKLREYNERDVLIMQKAFRVFINDIKEKINSYLTEEQKLKVDKLFKKVPLTIASVSYKLLGIISPVVYEKYQTNEYFRNFYFGGRTEALNLNYVKNVYYYDFNSLYPFAMFKYTYPSRRVLYEDEPEFLDLINDEYVGVEVTLIEKTDYPLFPVRYKGKTMFPKGLKRVFVFKEEMLYFLSEGLGEVLEIHKVFYAKQEPIFRKFVKMFYALRKNSSIPFYNQVFKLFLNSSYGKFAERAEKETFEIRELTEGAEMDIGVKGVFREEKVVKPNLNVLYACKITAMARLELHKAVWQKMKNGEKVYYTDTDSLVCAEEIQTNALELGALKKELEMEEFQCLGAKEYFFKENGKGITKMKGFGQIVKEGKIVKTKTVNDQIEDFIKFYTRTHEMLKMIKIKTGLKDLEKYNYVNTMFKRKQTFYVKRKVKEDLTTEAISTEELNKLDEIEEQNAKIIKEKIIEKVLMKPSRI